LIPLNQDERVVVQFINNIKTLKHATIEWERKKKKLAEKELISTEAGLQSIYDSEKGGFSSP